MESLARPQRPVNNAIYAELGARWYDAEDDPVALLRAESHLRNPWIAEVIERKLGPNPARVLDVGCGGGFLSNALALLGHEVTGLDEAAEALEVARARDATRSVRYELGDALQLAHPDASFDVVCAMDFLEHVEEPERAVAEMARVLRPGGLFFFHTFNRNRWAELIVIRGVEWFVKNTPKDMHVLHLFIKPEELRAFCNRHGLETGELRGTRPHLGAPFWRMLWTGRVSPQFSFVFTDSTRLAYSGWAERRRGAPAGP